MARQPFLPAFEGRPYAVGYNCLDNRPRFAELVGRCISVWSYVDNEMGTILGLLLGTHSPASLEVFLNLRRSSSQKDALDAAARHSLSGDNLMAFRALLAVYKRLEKERNDLAHGLYGNLADDEAVILWIEVKYHVHFMAEVITGVAPSHDQHARLKKNLFVYRLSDLERTLSDMNECWEAAFNFDGWLRDRRSRSWQLDQCCDLPSIRSEIERLRADA